MFKYCPFRSESKAIEEESDMLTLIAGFSIGLFSVGFCELRSQCLFNFCSGFSSLETFFFDFFQVKIIDDKSSRHNMVLIYTFDKRFHTCSLNEFFFVDATFNLSGISGNTH